MSKLSVCLCGRQVVLLPLAMYCVGGCGGESDRVAVYPVRGEVTYQGKPAEGAKVAFYAAEGQDARTPIPTAVVQPDGSFQLTSYAEGDGAPAGAYRVTVVWPEPIPPDVNHEMFTPADRLRGRYSDPETSGLEATVVEDQNSIEPFTLQ